MPLNIELTRPDTFFIKLDKKTGRFILTKLNISRLKREQ